jgi:biopolymer transport protein ExbB/TolQ
MAKGILLILFIFSVVAWAIMAYKLISLRAARMESKGFLKRFRSEKDPSRLSIICRRFKRSHLARVLETGLLKEQDPARHWWRLPSGEIREILDRAVSSEIMRLEEMLVLLAIGGSVCPLLGLLTTEMENFAHEVGSKFGKR